MRWQIRLLTILIVVSMVLVSCGTKSTTDDDNQQNQQQQTDTKTDEKKSDVKQEDKQPEKADAKQEDKQPEKADTKEPEKKPDPKVSETEKVETENVNKVEEKKPAVDIKTIFFEFDSYVLTDSAKASLKKKYEWLKENTGVKIQIEGHCDVRGTTAYNIALGKKRADRTKEFLINLGIDEERISTVSYGEEKAKPASTEAEHAKNRRSYFEQK